MFHTNSNSFRSITPSGPRIPILDTFNIVTTANTTFYQLCLTIISYSHNYDLEASLNITQTHDIGFTITKTYLLKQHNSLILIGSTDKFAMLDLSGGNLTYVLYPQDETAVPLTITDVIWCKRTNSLLFSCEDHPIQRYNTVTKRWESPLECTNEYTDIIMVAISNCERYLSFVTRSGSIYYHPIGSQKIIPIEKSVDMVPTVLRFALTSKANLVVGYPKGHIEIFNLSEDTNFTHQVKDYSNIVDISFYPQQHDFALVSTSSGRLLQVDFAKMNVSTFKALNIPIHSMDFGMDDCTLITSGQNNTLSVFNRSDPKDPLATFKIPTQSSISKIIPARCRNWKQISMKSGQTSPSFSRFPERRTQSFSVSGSSSRARSNTSTSNNSPIQNPLSPTYRNLPPGSNHSNLRPSTPTKSSALDNYVNLFSPAKNPNQFTNANGQQKPLSRHSASRSHLPNLESIFTKPVERGRSRSQYSDTSSVSANSPTRDRTFTEDLHQPFKVTTPVKKSRHLSISHRRHISGSESPELLSDHSNSLSPTESDNISVNPIPVEFDNVSRNGSLPNVPTAPMANLNMPTSFQFREQIDLAPIEMPPMLDLSSFTPERMLVATSAEVEELIERACGRIETRVQERIDVSQAQLAAQNAALQEQMRRMNDLLGQIPNMMQEIKQLRDENRQLRNQRN